MCGAPFLKSAKGTLEDVGMRIEKIVVGLLKVNCYILGADDGSAVVIDPGDNAPGILDILGRNGWHLEKILLTHGHFDHMLAIPGLRDATGAPYFIHRGDLHFIEIAHQRGEAWIHRKFRPLPPPDGFLKHGEIVRFGEEEVEVRHTPGHSPGGVSLVSFSHRVVFTGDTLLKGTVGRSDFPGGDPEQLIEGIRRQLMSLPDDFVVYPGHGAPTTIGDERVENPFLVLAAKGITP